MDHRGMKPDCFLFDFDGTLCRLFSRYDLGPVRRDLQRAMQPLGVPFSPEQDAFDVFGAILTHLPAGPCRTRALQQADALLTRAETEAAATGAPVPGVRECLTVLLARGCRLGVVTNNSPASVQRFLDRLDLPAPLPVAGRIPEHPEWMKPDPCALTGMLHTLGAAPETALFLGDTGRDLACARAAGCPFLGMVPTERKRRRLEALLPPDAMVPDYFALLDRLGLPRVP